MKAADSYPEKKFWSYITVTFWIHLLVKKVKCVNTSAYSTASKINVVWRTWYAAGGQTGLLKVIFFLVRFISYNSHLYFLFILHRLASAGHWMSMRHQPSFPGFFHSRLYVNGSPQDTFIKLPVSDSVDFTIVQNGKTSLEMISSLTSQIWVVFVFFDTNSNLKVFFLDVYFAWISSFDSSRWQKHRSFT